MSWACMLPTWSLPREHVFVIVAVLAPDQEDLRNLIVRVRQFLKDTQLGLSLCATRGRPIA